METSDLPRSTRTIATLPTTYCTGQRLYIVTSHRSEGPIQAKQGFVAEVVFGTDQHSEEVVDVGTLLDGNP